MDLMNKEKRRLNNEESIFFFTAAQLIEVLQTFPPHLPVLVSGYKSGFENVYHPVVIKLKHEPDNMYFDGQFQIANKADEEEFDAIILQREFRED